MANPVLVEVMRGDRVESRHRGAIAVFDAAGAPVLALGDIGTPVYPRSSIKAIQALPLVESGAADAYGFGQRELALAQASHSGEPQHIALVKAMLSAIGLDETALECGAQMPLDRDAAAAMIRTGEAPSQLHNVCSGKHAGFLADALHLGIPYRGYTAPSHPVQAELRAVMSEVTGFAHQADVCAIDGCSIPTHAAPLRALAHGFARFITGIGLSPERAAAARRIHEAAIAEPFYVAGTNRLCTEVMRLAAGSVQMKTGAEGMACAALPGLGLGVALKCDDGEPRASEAMMAAVLAHFLPEHETALRRWTNAPILTRRGALAGEVRFVREAFA